MVALIVHHVMKIQHQLINVVCIYNILECFCLIIAEIVIQSNSNVAATAVIVAVVTVVFVLIASKSFIVIIMCTTSDL